MRYLAAITLALGLATPAILPAESAQMVNQNGNVIVSRSVGNREVCYVDGAVRSCDQPVPVTLYSPSDLARLAGQPSANQYGNVVVARSVGDNREICYVDGAVRSCDQPVPVALYPPTEELIPAGSNAQPVRLHDGGHEGEK